MSRPASSAAGAKPGDACCRFVGQLDRRFRLAVLDPTALRGEKHRAHTRSRVPGDMLAAFAFAQRAFGFGPASLTDLCGEQAFIGPAGLSGLIEGVA